MTINEILKKTINDLRESNIEEPIRKARILLAFTIQQTKEYLITYDMKELTKEEISMYKQNIERLKKNEPIQYIIGKQEFMKLEFTVNKNVLIPRQDTEILVEEVLKLCEKKHITKVLDLCTGSGVIAITLSKSRPKIKVYASDISKKALEVAKLNNRKLETNVEFIQSDLFQNVNSKFDVIVSNPPYIKTNIIGKLEKQVQKEPMIALDGGKDGLKIYRSIINNAYKYIKGNGYLCLEIGYDQKSEIIQLLNETQKYEEIYSKKDLSKNDRIIICQKRKE